MIRRLLLGAVAVFLLAFVVLPLLLLALGLSDVSLALGEGEAIWNTVLLSLGAAAVALGCGLPIGWVAARRKLPPLLESAITWK